MLNDAQYNSTQHMETYYDDKIFHSGAQNNSQMLQHLGNISCFECHLSDHC